MLLACVYLTTGCGSDFDDISVSDPWIAEAPPTATVMAAYMRIDNHSDRTRRLLSISGPRELQIALHHTSDTHGMLRMNQVDTLEIPANGQVLLAQGGYHLMIHGSAANYRSSSKMELNLMFEDGMIVPVIATVKSLLP